MKNKSLLILFTALASSCLFAGDFHIKQGNLLNDDKVDIQWRKQYGNCPTKYPVESVDCTYTYSNIRGLIAKHLKDINRPGFFTTENTYELNISLNVDSKKKEYPFNTASCQNLQSVVHTGSVITINKSGCSVS